MSAAALDNVTKIFRNGTPALAGVSFEIKDGHTIGLLGRNGAGKTTLINILMGFVHQTSGEVTVLGREPGKAYSRCGYVPDNPHFHEKESVFSLLMILARMRKIEKKCQRQRCNDLIETLGLGDYANTRIAQLSQGNLKRFAIAQALLGDPDFVVMDEPLSALDPVGQSQAIDIIRSLKRPGRTIIISSHLLFHMEKICDRVLILDAGRQKFFGRLDAGKAEVTSIRLRYPVSTGQSDALRNLGIKIVDGRDLEIDHGKTDIHLLLLFLADNRLEIDSLSRSRKTLEETFLELLSNN